MLTIPGGINLLLSGLWRFPREAVLLWDRIQGDPGMNINEPTGKPTGSNRVPGGAPIGDKQLLPPYGPRFGGLPLIGTMRPMSPCMKHAT
jgi:hypothetical protein